MAKRSEPGRSTSFLTVDRVEEGVAVLVSDEGSRLEIPAALLPPGAAEGTVLRLVLETDQEETRRRTESVRDLQRRLLEGNG